ncbi:hypothetical protein ACGFYV_14185 [Streptomyces sp. NPDC048297]|uniref:hypothetical protein n=1 Tax=Streptomyces sp. NPDC048297 TaxID=3365531 RepID=UPI003715C44B
MFAAIEQQGERWTVKADMMTAPQHAVDDSVYDAIRAAVIRLIRSREIRPDSSAGPVYFVLYDVEGEQRARELAAALHAALHADLNHSPTRCLKPPSDPAYVALPAIHTSRVFPSSGTGLAGGPTTTVLTTESGSTPSQPRRRIAATPSPRMCNPAMAVSAHPRLSSHAMPHHLRGLG